VSLEALKCLVNFALRALEIEGSSDGSSLVLQVLREAKEGPAVVLLLEAAAKVSPDSEEVFAFCRLLNMMLWDAEIMASINDERFVDLLLTLLKHSVTCLEKDSNSGPVDMLRFSIAGDVARMFFQLTMEFGPLNKNHAKSASAYPITSESVKLEDQTKETVPVPAHISKMFENSMEILKTALLFDFKDPRKSQLQLACVTYALNLPKEQILKFDAFVVLPHLMNICHFHLENKTVSASASMLMLFTKIARDEPRTRAIFMQKMFPEWKAIFEDDSGDNVKMPKQHEGTTGKLVIDCMQSSNAGLQFYANEFVFLLCNENAGAFTKFVGFGPAAGHLAVRGLMNMGGATGGGGRGAGTREVVEGGDRVTPIGEGPGEEVVSNWKEKKIDDPDMADLSPEDVKEWNDLCDKMERLDDLGVIKMVTKKDEKK
jgi:hypothetical protein